LDRTLEETRTIQEIYITSTQGQPRIEIWDTGQQVNARTIQYRLTVAGLNGSIQGQQKGTRGRAGNNSIRRRVAEDELETIQRDDSPGYTRGHWRTQVQKEQPEMISY
jgi:hypothetical protein